MMDDVVGLVMVQIISSIGGSGGATISAVTVTNDSADFYRPEETKKQGFVAGASYAGTSALFAAYEAGACISWWDGSFLASPANTEVQTTRGPDQDSNVEKKVLDGIAKHEPKSGTGSTRKELSGAATYEKYYKQPVERILKPFFFASIGFSIPITQMFTGAVVWRGIVYTLLMAFGKLLCGVWLIRFDSRFKEFATVISHFLLPHNWYSPSMSADEQGKRNTKRAAAQDPDRNDNAGNESPEPDHQTESPDTVATASVSGSPDAVEPEGSKDHQPHRRTSPTPDPKISPKIESFSEPRQDDPPARAPLSLQPALILAFAMVSRGEIGFLVSSIAASNGIFSSDSSSETSDVFLIVTWAIVLCTFVGPVCVGLLVRRLRSLEKQGAGRWDGLGVWGIGS
ncbi:MAG: hypothetical protein M1820_003270 [Bogoriella megaspora]|nr:MAG: hypothetical protein M1820_003270 [Bogoriella megaspora]